MKKKLILILLFCSLFVVGCNKETNEKKEVQEVAYTLSKDEEAKVSRIVEALQLDDKNFQFNKLDNQRKLELILLRLWDYENNLEYTKENVLKTVEEYFGKDASITLENFNCPFCDNIYYLYNSKTEKFEDNMGHLGHGGSGFDIYKKVDEVVKKGDKIIVRYKAIFTDFYGAGSIPSAFYNSFDDLADDKKSSVDFNEYCTHDEYYIEFNCNQEKLFKEKSDVLNTYEFVFAYQDYNFYLESYSIK